jgi:ABC-type Na+ transport system ATPase subunit NatA
MRLTVRQNLEVFARLYGVRDLKGRIAETAHDFKLRSCWTGHTASFRPARRRA